MLVTMSGRPGVGKTTIARELARSTGAVHVRIDSIEQTLRNCGVAVDRHGYEVAYAIAEDNLSVGRHVIADCVNPWPSTRSAWRSVAARVQVPAIDVEIVCADAGEHRRRVETRTPDIAGHTLPTWAQVIAHDYVEWDGDRLVVDTARLTVAESIAIIREYTRLPTVR